MLRKLFLSLFVIFLGIYQARAWTHGNASIVSHNITEYGGCTGNSDDSASFTAFNLANAGLGANTQVRLTINPGTTCCFTQAGSGIYWARGINNLLVIGNGATITDTCNAITGGGYFLGSKGIFPNADTTSAKTQSVSAGASCVTLVTSGQISLFTVGDWAVMTAVDLQGGPAYPPNPGIFEYVQILSKDAGTGIVCFSASLAYSYLSTYPNYYSGPEINSGGPATLYPLETQWYAFAEYQGLSISSTGQVYADLYSVKFTNVTFTGSSGCGVPSQNFIWTGVNVTATGCTVEVDKLIDTMNIVGGSWNQLFVQSSSWHTLNISGAAVLTTLNGTPETVNCNNATITNLQLGSLAYGRTKSFSGNECIIASISTSGFKENTNLFSISSGTISAAIENPPPLAQWAIPGSKPFFRGALVYEGFPFTINSLTTGGGNVLVGTTLSGSSFPTLPLQGGTDLFIQTDPMPLWSCVSCIGSVDAIDYSQAGAQNAPIYTYSSRTYTCAAKATGNQLDINNPPVLNMWGVPTLITVAVTTADTSVTTPLPFSMGTNYTNTSGALASITETVGLKTTGTRTMTPITTTGGQVGDTLVDLSAVANFGGQFQPDSPGVANNAGTCPVVTVTVQTTR